MTQKRDGMYTDADIEMAELEATGNRIARLERQGVCCHTRAAGCRAAPDLKPGELRCAGCGRVFASDEAWWDAMDEALA